MSKDYGDSEYAIPLHKYVGRNSYMCPREGCRADYGDHRPFEAHLEQCCPGLLDKFPTYASACLVDTGDNNDLLYEPPAIQQYIQEHPPLK